MEIDNSLMSATLDKFSLDNLIAEIDAIEDFDCKFFIYQMPDYQSPMGGVRLLIEIEYRTIYDNIYYMPSMDISFTHEEWSKVAESQKSMAIMVAAHFLNSHILTRDLNEYYH